MSKKKPEERPEEPYQGPTYDPPALFVPPQFKPPEPPPASVSSYDPPPPPMFDEGVPA